MALALRAITVFTAFSAGHISYFIGLLEQAPKIVEPIVKKIKINTFNFITFLKINLSFEQLLLGTLCFEIHDQNKKLLDERLDF
jgi:hypothetical protein